GSAPELPEAAIGARDEPSARRLVETLAVNAHARGDDETLDGTLDQRLQKNGGAEIVDGGVLGELVHALPDADHGGEVEHAVDAAKGLAHGVGISHVALDQLDLGIEVARPFRVGAVDLGRKIVESADPVAPAEQ